MLLDIFIYLIVAFVGYLIGRVGHRYLNDWLKNPPWAIHHWIYGFILMVVGLIFYKSRLGLLAFSLGIGDFISDFKDFLKLRVLGPDDEEGKKFWGID